jgi:hypothetical protein
MSYKQRSGEQMEPDVEMVLMGGRMGFPCKAIRFHFPEPQEESGEMPV